MFERALVIEYLSQSRNKTISGIRMKNSIFESHFGKMLLTWVTLMYAVFLAIFAWPKIQRTCRTKTRRLTNFGVHYQLSLVSLLTEKSH